MIYGYKSKTGYIKLKQILSEKNIMQCFLADELGISISTFNRKINRNHATFSDPERLMLRKYLDNWDEDLFCYIGPNRQLVYQMEYEEV